MTLHLCTLQCPTINTITTVDMLSDQKVTLVPMNPWSVNLSCNRSLEIKQLLLNLYPHPTTWPQEMAALQNYI